jgi:type IV fimbrial biogenesis protein FimT
VSFDEPFDEATPASNEADDFVAAVSVPADEGFDEVTPASNQADDFVVDDDGCECNATREDRSAPIALLLVGCLWFTRHRATSEAMRTRASGFTLLELMIVIAIAGVLAAMAIPSFKYLASTTKLKSASTEMYLAMIRARNEAVKRNRQVAVVPNAAGWAAGWNVIVDADKSGAFTTGGGDITVMATSAPQRVTITEKNNLTQVVFLTSGRVQTAPSLQITSQEESDKKRCIRADLTGKPYTSEGACP